MPKAWEDIGWWVKTDLKALKKIHALLDNCCNSPFAGLGQPEALKANYSGYWSRRINPEHRIVYKVETRQIVVISQKGHYQDQIQILMRVILIATIFFIAACNSNEKQTNTETNAVTNVANGEVLFKANCASCHKPDKDFTGPALKGAVQRWDDKKAMYSFIRSPFKSVNENAYAKQLFEKWNKTVMTPFDLTDAEIDAIMNYCDNYKAIH